ncbi:MAG: PINc/VapC family ATPase [Nitrososphaeraceae archaeon]|nr:PINc/VapC family ATPase [Nitrososphaeraceae archaeon]MDW0138140.1 PINc/VapC family ATPase [Nitrososphaeraceae archaeon]MDW0142154.1 PINc/VapC family ATPase [Nitrososphaeraceae archaeon]MDW0143855.1 PINc/VapC family ATPase [Nitrososphaeraceae archaeon]MDW0147981.1 PINc/VapC family ATPase [Nitrososphaeraceae archaeon]
MTDKFVLDTSVIIDGKVPEIINDKIESNSQVIIPIAVLDELQAQASMNKSHGIEGLLEIKKIRDLCKARNISLEFSGTRPTIEEIRLAKHGRIDAIIKDIALDNNATLITCDYVQHLVSEAHGIKSVHISSSKEDSNLQFEKYFDNDTMSIHLKEGTCPFAKKGVPGNLKLIRLEENKLSAGEIYEITKEILEQSRSKKGFTEINKDGATVIQLGTYRIAITKEPFSDGQEITIVRPIAKLTLEDYGLSEKLLTRLTSDVEGIIIAGPPGSGKSTLASSLAEFYVTHNKIVKTFESPRDLQVPKEVTQYGPLEGSFENAVDILLLVRPDYTIFDEIRRYRDFQVFSDMKLAGVGMIGVIHASKPLDAVQRFIGRIELGMIPQILDTIIFMDAGMIKKVYEISLTVKVPYKMTEADLARPVVEVKDFSTGLTEYEIYTFGEENVIVPVDPDNEANQNNIYKLAESKIKDVIRRFDPNPEISIISDNKVRIKVQKDTIPRIIGKGGSTISELEDMLGVRIDVEMKTPTLGKEVYFEINESGNGVVIKLDEQTIGNKVNLYIDDEFICANQVGKKSRIKIDKRSESGRKILNAIIAGQKISIFQIDSS